MVKLLELIWGEGYMAPGGPGNVRKLLGGADTAGKQILDIGCGLGGPAMDVARCARQEYAQYPCISPPWYIDENRIRSGLAWAYFRRISSKFKSKQIAHATRPKSHSKRGASLPHRMPASVVSVMTGWFLL